jgi:hypothetical protein
LTIIFINLDHIYDFENGENENETNNHIKSHDDIDNNDEIVTYNAEFKQNENEGNNQNDENNYENYEFAEDKNAFDEYEPE